jgi:glycosyltransferase involved in cell wall biosynthesis
VSDSRKLISVVVPAYNEGECVDELARRLKLVFDQMAEKYDFEVIIVENGSHDDTYEKLVKIHEADSRFTIIQLSRNFLMEGGMIAGLDHAKGDACVIMCADLQDPPELISDALRPRSSIGRSTSSPIPQFRAMPAISDLWIATSTRRSTPSPSAIGWFAPHGAGWAFDPSALSMSARRGSAA